MYLMNSAIHPSDQTDLGVPPYGHHSITNNLLPNVYKNVYTPVFVWLSATARCKVQRIKQMKHRVIVLSPR